MFWGREESREKAWGGSKVGGGGRKSAPLSSEHQYLPNIHGHHSKEIIESSSPFDSKVAASIAPGWGMKMGLCQLHNNFGESG